MSDYPHIYMEMRSTPAMLQTDTAGKMTFIVLEEQLVADGTFHQKSVLHLQYPGTRMAGLRQHSALCQLGSRC